MVFILCFCCVNLGIRRIRISLYRLHGCGMPARKMTAGKTLPVLKVWNSHTSLILVGTPYLKAAWNKFADWWSGSALLEKKVNSFYGRGWLWDNGRLPSSTQETTMPPKLRIIADKRESRTWSSSYQVLRLATERFNWNITYVYACLPRTPLLQRSGFLAAFFYGSLKMNYLRISLNIHPFLWVDAMKNGFIPSGQLLLTSLAVHACSATDLFPQADFLSYRRFFLSSFPAALSTPLLLGVPPDQRGASAAPAVSKNRWTPSLALDT